MNDKRLYDFLIGERTNYHGITIQEIWNFSDKQLESCHNYIQWLFPLTEPSLFNPMAPFVENVSMFDNQTIRDNMITSLAVMCNFYGFTVSVTQHGISKIAKSDDFSLKAKNWLTVRNHNYLRLTRILLSLQLFGLEKEAELLFAVLQEIYDEYKDVIGDISYNYWKEAAEKNL